MTNLALTAPARRSTRLAFFASGFAFACLAPLFPFVKQNIGADEALFGLMLMCLGVGSLIAMPIAGLISTRTGTKPAILAGCTGLVLFFPIVALSTSPGMLGIALFLFGASLGTVDVAMNIHGAQVEGLEKRSLMSNFHAMFSIGALCGAGLITLFLLVGLPYALTVASTSIVVLICTVWARAGLLNQGGGSHQSFAIPRGIVWLLALLTAIAFLVEGAFLDWSALLLIEIELSSIESAGLGYFLFSIAMVVSRISGSWLIDRLGEFIMLFVGALLTSLSILLILMSPAIEIAYVGFIVAGLGIGNLVPMVFSIAGRQKTLPPEIAIAAVTMTGYAGILVGPPMMGLIAQSTSLPWSFTALAVLIAIYLLVAKRISRI